MKYSKSQITGLAMFFIPIVGGFAMLGYSMIIDFPEVGLLVLGSLAYAAVACFLLTRK